MIESKPNCGHNNAEAQSNFSEFQSPVGWPSSPGCGGRKKKNPVIHLHLAPSTPSLRESERFIRVLGFRFGSFFFPFAAQFFFLVAFPWPAHAVERLSRPVKDSPFSRLRCGWLMRHGNVSAFLGDTISLTYHRHPLAEDTRGRTKVDRKPGNATGWQISMVGSLLKSSCPDALHEISHVEEKKEFYLKIDKKNTNVLRTLPLDMIINDRLA